MTQTATYPGWDGTEHNGHPNYECFIRRCHLEPGWTWGPPLYEMPELRTMTEREHLREWPGSVPFKGGEWPLITETDTAYVIADGHGVGVYLKTDMLGSGYTICSNELSIEEARATLAGLFSKPEITAERLLELGYGEE